MRMLTVWRGSRTETRWAKCISISGLIAQNYAPRVVRNEGVIKIDTTRRKAIDSYLQYVALARDHFVEHGVDEESDEEAGDETGDDDDGEGFLRVRADAGGERSGDEAETGYERGHHNGTQAQQRSLTRSLANSHAFLTQLVDVGDEDDRSLH